MSAANDEADAGPEISTNELESDPGSGQEEDEERLGLHSDAQTRTGIIAHDLRETPSAVAEDVEFNDYVEADQWINLEARDVPGITERPSSADGSLSVPDDTPSLQVASHGILTARLPC